MVDVLHHLEFPVVFFREAERVLRRGGRIIMVEPAITWGSSLFYRLFHHEPVRMSADALAEGSPTLGRDPYASNQAIPTRLATRDRDRFHRLFPALRIARVEWFSLVAYPLSGGFKSWTLISEGLARRLLRIERAAEPIIGRFMSFRMMRVLEKISESLQRNCRQDQGRDLTAHSLPPLAGKMVSGDKASLCFVIAIHCFLRSQLLAHKKAAAE